MSRLIILFVYLTTRYYHILPLFEGCDAVFIFRVWFSRTIFMWLLCVCPVNSIQFAKVQEFVLLWPSGIQWQNSLASAEHPDWQELLGDDSLECRQKRSQVLGLMMQMASWCWHGERIAVYIYRIVYDYVADLYICWAMFHLTSRVAPYPNLIQKKTSEMPWFVTVWRPLSSAFAESWKIYGEMGNFSIWITGLRRGWMDVMQQDSQCGSQWMPGG